MLLYITERKIYRYATRRSTKTTYEGVLVLASEHESSTQPWADFVVQGRAGFGCGVFAVTYSEKCVARNVYQHPGGWVGVV